MRPLLSFSQSLLKIPTSIVRERYLSVNNKGYWWGGGGGGGGMASWVADGQAKGSS